MAVLFGRWRGEQVLYIKELQPGCNLAVHLKRRLSEPPSTEGREVVVPQQSVYVQNRNRYSAGFEAGAAFASEYLRLKLRRTHIMPSGAYRHRTGVEGRTHDDGVSISDSLQFEAEFQTGGQTREQSRELPWARSTGLEAGHIAGAGSANYLQTMPQTTPIVQLSPRY